MLPRLVINAGVAALAVSFGVFLAKGGPEHRDYAITIKKANGTYSADAKSFLLAYHGTTNFDIVNDTDDDITFDMAEFERDGANDCPMRFIKGGDTQICVGSVRLPNRGASKPVKVSRGDTRTARKFSFVMKVNGVAIDPDIEIERDPYGLIIWAAIAGGILSILVGWWVGRKR